MSANGQARTMIGRHGVIGDMGTLALVGDQASIEWMCWPRFDSPSIFGSLLDGEGGSWQISPDTESVGSRQLYLPETNVLITRFHSDAGLVEVEDFMTVGQSIRRLVRRVTGVRGTTAMTSTMSVRPDYGRGEAKFNSPCEDRVAITFDVDAESVTLHVIADVPMEVSGNDLCASFQIEEGQTVLFCLSDAEFGSDGERDYEREVIEAAYMQTVEFWREWLAICSYEGRWREIVHRSALVLKLLTHSETGGVIAAGTTSLPEAYGGERNWDYRYVWIRDAAFTLYAFLELGFTTEAAAFTRWLQDRLSSCDSSSDRPPLTPLYDLDGNADLEEKTLDHWDGYADSRPVRIGNGAAGQLQMDIYGEIIDSLYLADKYGSGLSLDSWADVRRIVNWVAEYWEKEDQGMWEVRSDSDNFTSSLLMCWVALERGVRMATRRGRPADLGKWRDARDKIHERIVIDAWSEKLQSFTQTLNGESLDASLLLMPLVKFISPTDPKWLSTLDAIGDHLAHDALVDRYDQDVSPDGLEGEEGSFSICSFWYVEAMARAGRVDQARLLFEKMLTYSGPLGLYSEVISPSGQQLGNYPQAFTHLALISAAVHLDEVLP